MRSLATTPRTIARYIFFTVRALNCAESAAFANGVLAMTITPEVSLSRRCTIPGRSTPPASAMVASSGNLASSASTRVAIGMSRRRMHGHPGGFVDDDYFGVGV